MTQGFKANPGLELANAFSVLRSKAKPPIRYRGRVKTLKSRKSVHRKSFGVIEKCLTRQLWAKNFLEKFFSRVFPQSLPPGGTDFTGTATRLAFPGPAGYRDKWGY